MNDRQTLAGIVVLGVVLFVVLVVAGLGVPGATPDGPSTTETTSRDGVTATPTETAAGTPTSTETPVPAETTSDEPTTTSAETTTTPQTEYGFTVDDIQECGTTCREVTVTLTNNRDEPRSDVVVETTLLADDDVVWEGRQTIGTLGPRASVTDTKTVDVGLSGGFAIQQNDGYVTIRTTVTSASGTVTYEERRKVA